MSVDEMPAGRELDALVAERLFGWVRVTCDDYRKRDGAYFYDLQEPDNDLVGRSSWRIADADAEPWEHSYLFVPYYSTDIAAAWQVVEYMYRKVADYFAVARIENGVSPWNACFRAKGSDDAFHEAWGGVAPLAICRAALKATEGA